MGAMCPCCAHDSEETGGVSKATVASTEDVKMATEGDFADLLDRPSGDDVRLYIKDSMLGPPRDLIADDLPDWMFELEPGKWKSYPLEESIELDRYWSVYSEAQWSGKPSPRPYLAKVHLMKRDGLVDFVKMTCQVGGGRPRSLKREVRESDWLSSAYFFEAFKAALKSAGVQVENTPEQMFDFRFNQDFRGLQDDGRKLFRGGEPYELPLGWKRFAVNVKGQYDKGDNSWLKEDDTGWAVAYHGTAKDSLPGILCMGFRVGDRQKFAKETGAGVYCTPWIEVAQHYSKPQRHDGHTVQIVLQLRVRPSAIRHITDPKATDFERKYWVVNRPEDIRAYGVLVRELPLSHYVPPEVMVYGKDHPATRKLLAELRADAQRHKH
mmetsp:Transcript_115928/g.322816  ORF Transcript_115928/g.322816 Transcript_115928/m.322816 type:complete len:381 (+) Transcript_115928:79-1221(+)